jgi:hypothetical protein
MKGFRKGDPRARAAGRKGGRMPRVTGVTRTREYKAGYGAGWVACERFYRPERVKGPAVPVSLGSLARGFDPRRAAANDREG